MGLRGIGKRNRSLELATYLAMKERDLLFTGITYHLVLFCAWTRHRLRRPGHVWDTRRDHKTPSLFARVSL